MSQDTSREVNLPTGAELKSEISRILDIDCRHGQWSKYNNVTEAFNFARHRGNFDLEAIISAMRIIRRALPLAISIDNLVHQHQGNAAVEFCAKVAIVDAMLKAEHQSIMWHDWRNPSTLDFSNIEDTWFAHFFKLLTENCSAENLEGRFKSVAFIVFNYDRCIEHFLYNALSLVYRLPDEEIKKLVANIVIIHPYGKVGNLPWQAPHHAIPFGEKFGEPECGHQLFEIAGQIRTFTQGTDPEASEIQKIARLVDDSQLLIFLGFSFNRLNLELLNSNSQKRIREDARTSFATAHGISPPDIDAITSELANTLKLHRGSIKMHSELMCAGLFQHYSRRLSFVN